MNRAAILQVAADSGFSDTQCPRYFIRTPYNGVLASQTRHDYCPQSSMIRGVMSPGLVGRW
ncbi:hypothetical protein CRT55_15025 [Escherichia coli]|uniref:hypothetical protein n=1 Tax=Escherichia coli TaxID=562 RepID=UPI000C7C8160|nr:hypothetical protein [Escherichia coli]AUL85221.1 hypothetical protein CRT55_15025 [Escherichia coli]AUL90102.1 hypothetical protein CR916_13485 [Escherichia coli]